MVGKDIAEGLLKVFLELMHALIKVDPVRGQTVRRCVLL